MDGSLSVRQAGRQEDVVVDQWLLNLVPQVEDLSLLKDILCMVMSDDDARAASGVCSDSIRSRNSL